ncbi:Flagellar biosynthetic protein FliO [Dissulfuribacter thermophilus]|uniref:Flagellar biosynthetic protein FliO n=1 Tax=Dissulfuribacter thermophilus TaxID=1156395 RepID=A0A1B9F855_9BACT|nr:flagellar biosynthetic protein FliO [Dissulfuribacter thermophilus]OCC16096.1 Flagellar biosynthetic protein FliO [Dissulfuribacter thermophilus]
MDSVTFPLLIKTIGALSIILGMLLAFNYAVRRWGACLPGKGSKDEQIHVVSTKQILPKKYISIVRVADNELILGISDAGINLLGELNRGKGDSGVKEQNEGGNK